MSNELKCHICLSFYPLNQIWRISKSGLYPICNECASREDFNALYVWKSIRQHIDRVTDNQSRTRNNE